MIWIWNCNVWKLWAVLENRNMREHRLQSYNFHYSLAHLCLNCMIFMLVVFFQGRKGSFHTLEETEKEWPITYKYDDVIWAYFVITMSGHIFRDFRILKSFRFWITLLLSTPWILSSFVWIYGVLWRDGIHKRYEQTYYPILASIVLCMCKHFSLY